MENGNAQGVVLQLQDYSIHDGAGVRTIIFLAGCPLRCQWCANPESWTLERKLFYYRHKCKECSRCQAACPQGLCPATMERPNALCDACGKCVAACPHKALALACTEKTVAEITQQIERDGIFFRFTGGGVTFSGGEPFYQLAFITKLINSFYDAGINMWIETCGNYQWDSVKDLVAKLDHVFMDIKHLDPQLHKKYTGVSNVTILQNIKHVYELGIPLTLRMPAMMDVNMTESNLHALGNFIQQNVPKAEMELLPYHQLGKAKFLALGGKAENFKSFKTPESRDMEHAYEILRSYGVNIVEYR